MISFKVDNVKLQYDCKKISSKELEKIVDVIRNNSFLFSKLNINFISLIPTSNDGEYYVEDFDLFYEELVKLCFSILDNNSDVNDDKLLVGLYSKLLKKNEKLNVNSAMMFSGYNNDMINNILAYKYYLKTDNFHKSVEFLKTGKNTDEIMEWLKDSVRSSCYKEVLDKYLDKLKQDESLDIDINSLNLVVEDCLKIAFQLI